MDGAFQSLGYSLRDEFSPNDRYEIARYGDSQGTTHVARRLAIGTWTSKPGEGEGNERDTVAGLEDWFYGSLAP